MNRLRLLVLVLTAVVCACATVPTTMPFTGPGATLEFTKGYSEGMGLGKSTTQIFLMADKPDCPMDIGVSLHGLSAE